MEPKGGNSKSSKKRSSRVSSGHQIVCKQYERTLPLLVPDIRPWGGLSKFKDSAFGDVSTSLKCTTKLQSTRGNRSTQAIYVFAVLQGAKLTGPRVAPEETPPHFNLDSNGFA